MWLAKVRDANVLNEKLFIKSLMLFLVVFNILKSERTEYFKVIILISVFMSFGYLNIFIFFFDEFLHGIDMGLMLQWRFLF